MRFKELTHAVGRLAVMTDKSGTELDGFLAKWFEKHFVKRMTLALLRSMHGSDALAAFLTFVENGNEAVAIAIARKLDPHRPDLMRRSRAAMIEHIVELAAGSIEPASKQKAQPKPKKVKSQPAVTGGVAEHSRLSRRL